MRCTFEESVPGGLILLATFPPVQPFVEVVEVVRVFFAHHPHAQAVHRAGHQKAVEAEAVPEREHEQVYAAHSERIQITRIFLAYSYIYCTFVIFGVHFEEVIVVTNYQ